MDKITHTPTPWELYPASIYEHDFDFKIKMQEGRYCLINGISEANAEYICRAVNSHEGLVEALRKIANLKVTPECFTDFQMSDKRRILAEEALKKAADGEGVK